MKFSPNLTMMFSETSESLLDRYSLAGTLGFKGVECAFPYDYAPEEIKDRLSKWNMDQILINTPKGDSFGVASLVGKEQEFIANLMEGIRYCKQLGCSMLHIMAGKKGDSQDTSYFVYKSNLLKAIPILEEANIIGLIEPINSYSVSDYFLNEFSIAEEILNDINSPNLKLLLDIFHLQFICGNLTRNLEKYLPITGHIQIAQVPDRHEPDSLGEINFDYIFKQLNKLKYEGWIGLEYKNTQPNFEWINKYGYSV